MLLSDVLLTLFRDPQLQEVPHTTYNTFISNKRIFIIYFSHYSHHPNRVLCLDIFCVAIYYSLRPANELCLTNDDLMLQRHHVIVSECCEHHS